MKHKDLCTLHQFEWILVFSKCILPWGNIILVFFRPSRQKATTCMRLRGLTDGEETRRLRRKRAAKTSFCCTKEENTTLSPVYKSASIRSNSCPIKEHKKNNPIPWGGDWEAVGLIACHWFSNWLVMNHCLYHSGNWTLVSCVVASHLNNWATQPLTYEVWAVNVRPLFSYWSNLIYFRHIFYISWKFYIETEMFINWILLSCVIWEKMKEL